MFVAEELSLGRKVVVKVLPLTSPRVSTSNDVAVNPARRKAPASEHSSVLAAGRSNRTHLLYDAVHEGESLRARRARSGELPIAEAARILRDG